ncbi:DUF1015 domain-containing protein [Phnomibacter ginsenosidimutans]|uniref:DUF1015 family protein n=1 Tax=Phnomibacter ginsenosidimutans TaxID=2676868 RepID=A0A6I6GS07_9BACT|nr:DUF1015 family protein [Phnomibacter ginsenosidimutans]QGW29742.1 DUF1015 family protein [Phnomibacter ginsenosidimutans]
MAHIQPFKALRPDPQFAAGVASRPYDVMSRSEAKDEARGNPNSFLHITRSEIDLPDTVSAYDEQVYQTAKSNLKAFLSRNVLFKEAKPCYYLYRLTMNGRSQSGLVCVSSVEDYNKDIIKKHEFTRPEKENDRIQHIVNTGAQTGNVFLAYRNVAAIDEFIANWQTQRGAVYDFTAEDGVKHEIWVINNDKAIETITQLFETEVPCTYIADGHHRAASAAKSQALFTSERAKAKADWFLTTLFPADQLYIMDYNRVVTDLNGLSKEAFLEKTATHFTVEAIGRKPLRPAGLHEFGMYLDKTWYRLTAKEGTYSNDPIGVLDVTILQDNLLAPVLGIVDQRTDKRIDFVGGIRGLEALQERVDSGEMAVAFSLYPVTIHQLFDIADSGNVMPPKSTWFEPKLRDGLLTHLVGQL